MCILMCFVEYTSRISEFIGSYRPLRPKAHGFAIESIDCETGATRKLDISIYMPRHLRLLNIVKSQTLERCFD